MSKRRVIYMNMFALFVQPIYFNSSTVSYTSSLKNWVNFIKSSLNFKLSEVNIFKKVHLIYIRFGKTYLSNV